MGPEVTLNPERETTRAQYSSYFSGGIQRRRVCPSKWGK